MRKPSTIAAIVDCPAPSRPLPHVEVSCPSAARGIPDVRAHLDGPRCGLCGVPVAEDEQRIRADVVGTTAYVNVCKGHYEHPETVLYYSWENAKTYTRCGRCNRLVPSIQDSRDGVCLGCWLYLRDGTTPDYYSPEARKQIHEAGGES